MLAWNADRAEKPFECPECRKEVTLKQGRIRISHFAHRPPVTCWFGRGETEGHRRCKQALYEGLQAQPEVQRVEIEQPLGRQRADVYAEIRGVRVAFEVQVSTLSPAELEARARGYARMGVAVCWMHPYTFDGIGAGIDEEKYSPKQWERWIHAANFGRCYYWKEALWVQPVHFDSYLIEVEERSWYESGGYEQSAGGYTRHSKRYKTPTLGALAHLIRDFGPQPRQPYSNDSMTIPQCVVYHDRQRPWWSRRS